MSDSLASIKSKELRLAVVDALKRLSAPVSAGELRRVLPRPFQRPVAELDDVLSGLQREGAVGSHRDGKTTRYAVAVKPVGKVGKVKIAVKPVGKVGKVKKASASLEALIREAYLRVTGGRLNRYVRLAQLRAALPPDLGAQKVASELIHMQQRGSVVLFPMDDPNRSRPEDDAAAIRVSGERRDLVCIMAPWNPQ